MRKRNSSKIRSLLRAVAEGRETASIDECLRAFRCQPTPRLTERFEKLVRRLCIDEDSLERFSSAIPAFLGAPSAEEALLNLLRYIDNIPDASVFLSTLAHGKPITDITATIFGSSRYMTDILIRNPGLIYWLIEKNTWEKEETAESFETDLREDIANFHTFQGKLGTVKRYQRKMFLKIGARDLLGVDSIDKTTQKLSDLAQAIVSVVLEVLWREILARSAEVAGRGEAVGRADLPAAPESALPVGKGFAVLALGKLGGRELNYSSDIDLVYLCEDADEEALGFYRSLGRRLTEALSAVTDEGYLYRVDLRLRPDGGSGPLVNTITSMRIYYENRGKPWEFQAHLKSRVIAGDTSLGRRFLDSLSNLVFNPSLSYSPVEDIALIRGRIQDSISPGDRLFNIKLMEGGIRDIEFITQAIQLIHGAKYEEIRTTNTIEAIRWTSRKKLLRSWEQKVLLDAYRFFRLVEHRLQMMHQIKTHSIPRTEEQIELLARRVSKGPLGSFTSESFLSKLTTHLNRVRILSETFFSGEKIPETSFLLIAPDESRFAKMTLARYGLMETKRAIKVIHSMAYGTFPRLLDRKSRTAFERLLPLLLDSISKTGDPCLALTNVAKIAAANRSEHVFYHLLRDSEPTRQLVVTIAGLSSLFTGKFCNHVGVLDPLLEDPEGLLHSSLAGDIDKERLKQFSRDRDKRSEYAKWQSLLVKRLDLIELAAFALDAEKKSIPEITSRSLSTFAENTIAGLFESMLEEGERVAIFALGSFGVGEPRLKSDIDLLIVSDAADTQATSGKVQALNKLYSDGGIIKLDFRLRGEGKNAPLVQDISFYRRYLKERVSPWERIAFSKCRFWSGSREVSEPFFEELASCLSKRFSRREMDALLATRRKLEARVSKTAEPWETKRSKGGRYDIEYVCGLGIALISQGEPYPFSTKTADRLKTLEDRGILPREDAYLCREALRVFSWLEWMMELQEFSIPVSEKRRRYLQNYLNRTISYLGLPIEGDILETLDRYKRSVRACFERLIEKLG